MKKRVSLGSEINEPGTADGQIDASCLASAERLNETPKRLPSAKHSSEKTSTASDIVGHYAAETAVVCGIPSSLTPSSLYLVEPV